MTQQNWFEMREIRDQYLEGAAWLPLRQECIWATGTNGAEGFKEEFLSTVTLAVQKDDESLAHELQFRDLTQGFGNYGRVENSTYIPSDTYDHFSRFSGTHLVLEQNFGGLEERQEWLLHQDLVLTLGLKRENDVWVRPYEGYEIVARETREDGKPKRIEVRSEHLKDYLCARDLSLIVITFRSRTAILSNRDHISWPSECIEETSPNSCWVGHVQAIHEGGDQYGSKTAVFHISRSEADGHPDVPELDLPNDENIRTRSWELENDGRKLYRISGELWKTEVIQPGTVSPIVRGDRIPSTESFIVDAAGNELSGVDLEGARRWLWFKPELIMSVAHKRGGYLKWHTRETGDIGCSGDIVHFGINSIGLVNAYAKDVALLPRWLRRIWVGHNVRPDGGVSEELLAAQVQAQPADTLAPEVILLPSLKKFERVFLDKFGVEILQPHHKVADLIKTSHRFRAVDESGLLRLAKDLCRLIVERLDSRVLRSLISPDKEEKVGSLKLLEKLIATKYREDFARTSLTPLVGLNELRLADAHLPSSDYDEAFDMVGVKRERPFVMQGRDLIYSCASALYVISDAIAKGW